MPTSETLPRRTTRRIVALVGGRQDAGILRSTILALAADPRFELAVWTAGMAESAKYGSASELLPQGAPAPARRFPFLSDPPRLFHDTGAALEQLAGALDEERPDALLFVGDRTETLAAAVAATLARIPIVHLHGGEETEGAIDNAARHAITKMSHLHLVSHEVHAQRVRQMGEAPETVVVVGAPGLDNAFRTDLADRDELSKRLSLTLRDPIVVVTVHPTTLGTDALAETKAVAAAMDANDATYVITMPNADQGGEAIREFWRHWSKGRATVGVAEALGDRGYWGLLRLAAAVVGNSSSALIEAPVTDTVIVNVGDRQKNRFQYGRITNVRAAPAEVTSALRAALTERDRIPSIDGGYPAGPAAPRIIDALASWRIPDPPRKSFFELSSTTAHHA